VTSQIIPRISLIPRIMRRALHDPRKREQPMGEKLTKSFQIDCVNRIDFRRPDLGLAAWIVTTKSIIA
jgi:hypothetical protein